MTPMTAWLDWDAVAAGAPLPPLVVDVTATHIVAGALATRDFMPVHHDRAYANAQGAPDIFMNILSSNAYCSRYLTDWTGPNAFISRLAIRLGMPVHPGVQLTFAGSVESTSRTRDEEGAVIVVAFAATSDAGTHLSGTATLRPAGG